MKLALPLLTATFLTSGCLSSEPDVEIETRDKVNPVFHVHYVKVKVRAIEDEVTVKDIIVNRGNCQIENINAFNGQPMLPKTLKFGESVDVAFSAPCEASQVDVVTNKGSWSETY